MVELRNRRGRALVAMVALLATLAGCGLGPTDRAADEGDGLASGGEVEVENLDGPDSATTSVGLVNSYLVAASGGLRPAIDRMKAFLTDHAKESWRDPASPDNPVLTVVRVVGGPNAGPLSGNRTPVTVDYQTVGLLTDQGKIDELTALDTKQMTLWVVPDPNNRSNLRIDEIDNAPAGLILSDKALMSKYRLQPIYFWDLSYRYLIPDLRYLPLTINPDGRAKQALNLLQGGPSLWLAGAAQRLPVGAANESVVTQNGKLVVRYNAEAAAGGPESLQRLLFQVQWTLRTQTTPRVELRIADKVETPAAESAYLSANLATSYASTGQRYDIVDQKVVAVPAPGAAQAVLAAPENQNVLSAAIAGGGSIGAFVRSDNRNSRRLWIVRANGEPYEVQNMLSANMSRPSFVSPAGDQLLIAAGGRLYLVFTKDGRVVELNRNLGVTTVSVSPDGRRVAFVADNQLYVTSLTLTDDAVAIGSNPRAILSGQISPSGVAWTNEAWLTVVGANSQMWQVTADGVVAENLSGKVGGSSGVTVSDVVAYPSWPVRPSSDVLVTVQGAVSSYVGSLVPETSLKAPFFGN